MDITEASNFERYLFHLLGDDAGALKACIVGFKKTGVLNLGKDHDVLMKRVKEEFISSRATDDEITKVTDKYVAEFNYAPCPHTACGLFAVQEILGPAGHDVITLSTAHPGKFENYGPHAKACKPELPPQLENLLDRKKKVTRITKSSVRCSSFSSNQTSLATNTAATRLQCTSLFNKMLHSTMGLVPTPVRFKRACA
jgi:threonine synthase